MVWHIIILTIIVVVFNIWRYYHENDCDDIIEPETQNNEVNGE